MTPGFPKTWKPCRSPTWAAVAAPLPSLPFSSLPITRAPGSQPAARTAPRAATGTAAALTQPHAPGRASRNHPEGEQGGSGELRCPLPGPTGMGGVVGRPAAHSGDPGSRQPRALGTAERGEDGGWGSAARVGDEGRTRTGAGTHLSLGRGRPRGPAARKPGFRVSSARRWGLPPRPAGRGRRGCGRQGAALGRTLTPTAGSRVPAPASSLPPAPTAPRAAPQARAGLARAPRPLGARSGRVPPCPCPRLPSGDAGPAPRHGALLYPSRSRWSCRAPARGLRPCARLPRCSPEPSGRGPAGVARPRNSMQLRPSPQLLLGGPPSPGGRPQRPPRSAFGRAGSRGSRLHSEARARLLRGSGSPRPDSVPSPIAPSVSRQRNLRNASARARSSSRAHTQAHAGGELKLGRRSSFLSEEAAHVNSGKLLFLGIG